jgi:hypothetical protein
MSKAPEHPVTTAPATEFYELVRRKILPPSPGEFRISTAAVWSCALCGLIIDGMGGPGDGELCIRCGDLIKSGSVKMTETVTNDEN